MEVEPFTCVATGDGCAQCSKQKSGGTLRIDQSLELGHLFVLGDRYSRPLGLQVKNAPVQMGFVSREGIMCSCYGLGLSRMMGAIFQLYGYSSGVLFPDSITTSDVVIINTTKSEAGRKCTVELLDALGDVALQSGRDA